MRSAQPVVADLMRGISLSNLSQTKEVRVPLTLVGSALQLVVTRGPSLAGETILVWVEGMTTRSDLRSTVMTIETPLASCSIERDVFGGDPQLKIGDARFTVSDRYASLLEHHFGFPAGFAHD
jgi:hypothetical protein